MKTPMPKTFMSRVRTALPDLHPSERRLAEAVLDFPGDMAGYSASEIARLAGVSNATVSRFVRKLGYASYDAARKAIREEGRGGSALLRLGKEQDGRPGAAKRYLEQSQANVAATFGALDMAVIEDLASAFHGARRVWIVGFRAGHSLASYLAWQVQQAVPDVRILPQAGETLAEATASLSEQDVVVLLLLRRAPKVAWSFGESAAGAQLAVIGDLPSTEALSPRWHIACDTTSTGPLLNHVSVMALCNLLAARVLERAGPEGRARMGRIEDIHERLGEL